MASVFRKKDRKGRLREHWNYAIFLADGSRKSFMGAATKRETKRIADAHEADERKKAKQQQQPTTKSAAEAAEAYLAHGRLKGGKGGRPWSAYHAGKQKRNLAWWLETLKPETLEDISLLAVEEAVTKHWSHLAPKTVKNRVSSLRALCDWAVKRELLQRDPLAAWDAGDCEPVCPPRPLNLDEAHRLLGVASPVQRLQYEVAMWTGFRLSELRALRPEDLDGRFLCLDKERTKAKRDARLPVPEHLLEQLQKRAHATPAGGRLLRIPKGGASWLQLRKDILAAGIEPYTEKGSASWHSLRKTQATLMGQHASDPKTFRELVRHKHLDLTFDRYAATDDARKAEVVAAAVASFNGKCAPSVPPKEKTPQLAGCGAWRIGDSNP